RKTFLISQVQTLNLIGHQLLPFLPETAEKIIQATQNKILKIQPLFPRLK
ncbi:methionine--tRNA ligase, partial [Candidatus Roizmanbacteria bacterium CG_4_10_14_3_um_filter_33_21]